MVKCGVIFEVRTEFLNNIQTSFGFKGIKELLLSGDCKTYPALDVLEGDYECVLLKR
jgi:hypothetical protein